MKVITKKLNETYKTGQVHKEMKALCMLEIVGATEARTKRMFLARLQTLADHTSFKTATIVSNQFAKDLSECKKYIPNKFLEN
ncbi:hypothetical protein MITS9509_01550 [Synechococcus sp. MIT S9509]|uniref:hypothetical protein n=1 Tax=unclassified Synechococcus TaxID=2626047 RepID=UPI0007BC6FBB|nr:MULTISPECIES: hypothetical protein [unclassified Synechococcus]KZR88123.1 hypothetical protein MITS9504_00551 [Synechococcus sp. MIT S9504]KZR92093.1 hypothetical protein MITS9509_01550 [Synechococcus sp. MIT S9509]